jgi:glycosyltransferase involved in cell wall biosynthesis
VTPPLRILHYLDHFRFDAGGVCRAVMDLCTLLASRGHHVTLVTQDDADVPAEWKAARQGLPRAVHLPRPSRRGVERLVAEADSLHLHGMWTVTNLPYAAAARRLRVPYVFSPHGMLDDWCMSQRAVKKRLYLLTVGRRLLEHASVVLFAARAELDQSRKWLGRARAQAIPLILNLAPFRELPGPDRARARFPALTAGTPTILFLGRLHPIKRIDALIRACAVLRDQAMDHQLILAGAGEPDYERTVQALARETLPADRVHFLGMVVGTDKISLLQAADVLVLPSRHENFGFVAFEALAAGTPVVTTRDVCTWPELEASGGALVTDGSVGVLASALAQILRESPRRTDMGRSGREWTLRAFDPEALVRRYEAVYSPLSAPPDPKVPRAVDR